jgi:DNA-binding CsgD family transcriptional regulator
VDVAAVIGRRFDAGLLQQLAEDSLEAVEEALARGVLVADGAGLGFRHELIREALEESISPPRRTSLHARVFAVLARARQGVDSARLAHHAELGGLSAEAARYALLASAEAERMGALREMGAQSERALHFGSELEPQERFELLLRLSRALNFSSMRLDDAVAAAERAVQVADELGDPVRRGRALVALAWAQWSPERVIEARQAAEQAIATLQRTSDAGQLARAHSALIRMEATAFDPAEAVRMGPGAIELARRAGLEEVRLDVEISVALARGHLGEPESTAILWEVLGEARRRRLSVQVVRTYVNLVTAAVSLRDHTLVDRVTAEALPALEDFQTPIPAAAIAAYRARSLLDRGRFEEAHSELAAVGPMLQAEWPISRAFAALIRARCGHTHARQEIEQGWRQLGEMVAAESSRHGMVRLALVEAAWLAGDDAAALEHLRAARDSPATCRFARSGGELALWSRRYGVELAAPARAPEPVRHELEGDWRAAIRAWRELEAPYESALAALPGDDRAAREAVATLRRLGADGAVRAFSRERAARGARAARGPRRSTLANRAGLTRREQEVLEELAAGASNAEIAAALHLSQRTVAHHVSAILAKLGVGNRHLAVEQARERGLVSKPR